MEHDAPRHKGAARQHHQLNEMEFIRWLAQYFDVNLIEALWLDIELELEDTWGRIRDIPVLK